MGHFFGTPCIYIYICILIMIDYENKTQMLLNPILFIVDGVIIDREEKYALRSAEVYICQLPPKMQIYPKPSSIKKSSLHHCILHWWINFLIILTQNNTMI